MLVRVDQWDSPNVDVTLPSIETGAREREHEHVLHQVQPAWAGVAPTTMAHSQPEDGFQPDTFGISSNVTESPVSLDPTSSGAQQQRLEGLKQEARVTKQNRQVKSESCLSSVNKLEKINFDEV